MDVSRLGKLRRKSFDTKSLPGRIWKTAPLRHNRLYRDKKDQRSIDICVFNQRFGLDMRTTRAAPPIGPPFLSVGKSVSIIHFIQVQASKSSRMS